MNRALVVGIGDYGRLKQPLPGCANDRLGWSGFLRERLGLQEDALRVRGDSAATRETLLQDLAWLLSEAGPGDQRVFFFAGHGARLRRKDPATGIVDEKIDETIVVFPGEATDYESFMLFDADLAAMIDQSGFPSTALLTLIFDSCHSGGMMRPFLTDDDADIGAVPLPRCLYLEDDEVKAREFLEVNPMVRSFGSLERVAVPRVILAAAKPEQSAWDDKMPDGQRHGVFSYHALAALAAHADLSFDGLILAVAPLLAAKFPQTPVLDGDQGRFGGAIFN